MILKKTIRRLNWLVLPLVLLMAFPESLVSRDVKVKSNKAVIRCEAGRYKGTMLFIDEELLVLKEKNSVELLGFATENVLQVNIRKSKVAAGLLAGLGLGAVVLGGVALATPKKGNDFGSVFGTALLIGVAVTAALIFTVIATAGGGILGSLLGWKKFKLGQASQARRKEMIEKLRGFALLDELTPEIRSRLVMMSK